MAVPSTLKVFTSPVQKFDGSADANNIRANDNALVATVNALITEVTAIEGGTASSGRAP